MQLNPFLFYPVREEEKKETEVGEKKEGGGEEGGEGGGKWEGKYHERRKKRDYKIIVWEKIR